MFETPPATFVTLTINLFGRISVVNDLFFWVRRSKTFFDGVRLRKMCILCVPPWCNHHICYIYSDFFFITMQMRDNSCSCPTIYVLKGKTKYFLFYLFFFMNSYTSPLHNWRQRPYCIEDIAYKTMCFFVVVLKKPNCTV